MPAMMPPPIAASRVQEPTMQHRSALILATTFAFAGCTMRGPTKPHPEPAVRAPAPGVTVSGRIASDDVVALRERGVVHVIDLTPDAETPDFDEARAVSAAGLGYSNLPLAGAADLTLENVHAFDALMRESARPVLVHCASGNRVGAMAALRAAWIDGKPLEEAVAIGKAWGLTGLESEVRARIGSGTR